MDGDFLTPCYHAPIVKYFFLERLRLAFSFIDGAGCDNLLEIGFGSGVFFPQLKDVCRNLYGVDINPKISEVKKMCAAENLAVNLSIGSVLELPYKNNIFDCVVSMSTLEHIRHLEKAISEIRRVLKIGGRAVIGFPVSNAVTNCLLRLMGSESDHNKKLSDIHPSSHRDIIGWIEKIFTSELVVKTIPAILPVNLSLYCCCCCTKV